MLFWSAVVNGFGWSRAGAIPTDIEFFERADMEDTKVCADPKKDEPAKVARIGFEAMMRRVS